MFFVNRARGLFLSVHVDDIKLAGKTENIEPTWKTRLENVDLGEPTSFLDNVNLGCTQSVSNQQGYCDKQQRYVRIQDFCWSQGKTTEPKLQGKLDAETRSFWSYDMEGHVTKCVERYCELAKKTNQQ